MLDNVPVGADVPLVIQMGKWRREIKILPAIERLRREPWSRIPT